jgi:glycosyltransferase involved in cell wall biosynthesis
MLSCLARAMTAFRSPAAAERPAIAMINAPVHPIPPAKGAAVEWWMYQVSRRLRRFAPHLICLAGDGQPLEEHDQGVHFHRIRLGRLYRRLFQKITRLDPWSYARRAARHLDHLAPAILHVHNAPALAASLHRLCAHRPIAIQHMHNAIPLAEPLALERLVVNSRYLAGWYAERHPGLEPVVITNGVDLDLFRPRWEVRAETAALKRALGLPEDKRIVLYVGRVSPEKGLHFLLAAFERLAARRADVFLLAVGEYRLGGRDARSRYGEEIQARCEALGPARCRLHGVVPPGEIQRYYRLGDLLVVPSAFEEPFGMVAIEAMASGVPVLAARKGGLPEFVIPERTGFLIERLEDPEALAAQIESLLARTDLEAVARAARAYVEAHHGWDEVARQTEALYTELLAR